MKIQAINFNKITPKANISFRDRDIIINADGVQHDVFVCSRPNKVLTKGMSVLRQSEKVKKEAKKKYNKELEIAKNADPKINWSKSKKDGIARFYEFGTTGLEAYKEYDSNGKETIILYMDGKPFQITETTDGKTNTYKFDDEKLFIFWGGEQRVLTSKGSGGKVENAFYFDENEKLTDYFENRIDLTLCDEKGNITGSEHRADCAMRFQSERKTGTTLETAWYNPVFEGMLNEGVNDTWDEKYKFNSKGKLIG